MRAASRRPFAVALAALLVLALALRLWGLETGLPYVFNADENAHFVPRAIGMFGHSYNPGYFINPPALTYVLHAVFLARWGGGDAVRSAFAADPGSVFAVARAVSAVAGTVAVGLLAWAGARLFDRRVGLLAAALLAVAFLPVHYSHLALNDVPTLAPLCLALAGIAGILREGRTSDHVLAGVGLGLACATKYTAGIVLLPLLAAVALSHARPALRVRGLAIAGALGLAAFVVSNPYAVFDFGAFSNGLHEQSSASSDGAGKLGLTDRHGITYYLSTLTWGFGWLPALAALAAAVVLWRRDRRAWAVLVPAPVVFLLFMGSQERFFARWLLPVYPLLCLLAAWAAVEAASWLARRVGRPRAAALLPVAAGLLLCAQGLVFSVHNDLLLARDDTRQIARDWMVRHIPAGAKVVVEPIAPDQWAMDPGRPSRATGNGNRWNKWPTSRSRVQNDGTLGEPRAVKLEDYERTTRPELVGSYFRGGYCWVVTGSTQYGRAYADPERVPKALRYYDELRRRARLVYRVSPYGRDAEPVRFSFDHSFNYYPLAYDRPGPEIRIYRFPGCR
jgi:hypothetical protein